MSRSALASMRLRALARERKLSARLFGILAQQAGKAGVQTCRPLLAPRIEMLRTGLESRDGTTIEAFRIDEAMGELPGRLSGIELGLPH